MPIFKDNPFRPDADAPLYRSLYTHIRQAILSGELAGGTKLPSTRALAEELSISRNTVLNAYSQLLAEGYLEGKEGSGTFVARVLPEHLLSAPHYPTPRIAPPPRTETRRPLFSEHAKTQITAAQPPSRGNCRARLSRRPRRWMPFPTSYGHGLSSAMPGACQ